MCVCVYICVHISMISEDHVTLKTQLNSALHQRNKIHSNNVVLYCNYISQYTVSIATSNNHQLEIIGGSQGLKRIKTFHIFY